MMSKLIKSLSAGIISAALITGMGILPTRVSAATGADTAALQQAIATCQSQVKEQAQFHEMSWYARHKAVKNCVKETLTKH